MAIVLEEGYVTVGLIIILAVLVALVVFVFIPWFLQTSWGQGVIGGVFPGGS